MGSAAARPARPMARLGVALAGPFVVCATVAAVILVVGALCCFGLFVLWHDVREEARG